MRQRKAFALYLLLLSLLLPANREVMAMFGLGKTCVVSSVKAKLTRNGEPLKGVKVVRRWEWNELKEETTTTDENGSFEFAAAYETSIARFFPIELVIGQGIYVVEGGEEKQIWAHSKREPEENSEFHGRSIELSCEITNAMTLRKDMGFMMWTLCKWEN